MEDQGIMALPQGQAMQGPTTRPAAPPVTPEEMAAFDQARLQIDPKQFGDSLLAEGLIADPQTVQEFMTYLEQSELPPEIIDALGQMVDAILAEPEKYDEIRKELIAEGVPQELLPEEFDAAYFGAMNMALDQLNAKLMAPSPMGFAYGGEIKPNPIASSLGYMGRYGDTMLAHITPSEARMLRRSGGSGSINPMTGLPEFFVKKLGKSIGNAFKSVGKAVSNVVKGVGNAVKKFASSTVGRIVTGIALGFFLGPAAASLLGIGTTSAASMAISGFVGGFGSTMLAGGSFKDALKSGALAGITAGATSALSGAPIFDSATMTPGQAFSGQVDKFTGGIKSLMSNVFGPSAEVSTTQELARAGTPTPEAPVSVEDQIARTAADIRAQPPMTAADNLQFAKAAGQTATDAAATGSPLYQQTPAEFMKSVEPRMLGQQLPPGSSMTFGQPTGVVPAGIYETYVQPGIDKVKSFYGEYLSPSRGVPTDQMIIDKANTYKIQFPDLTSKEALELSRADLAKAAPGAIARYAPIITAGLGATALAGGFTPKQPGRPGIVPTQTGFDLLREQPDVYGVRPGGAYLVYGNPYQYPRGYEKGGIADIPTNFPRKNGHISGPGNGTSDDIPAMLSDGEFVFTAKAVRAAGNGSRRVGAKRMYAMMKALERKANG